MMQSAQVCLDARAQILCEHVQSLGIDFFLSGSYLSSIYLTGTTYEVTVVEVEIGIRKVAKTRAELEEELSDAQTIITELQERVEQLESASVNQPQSLKEIVRLA